MVAATKKKVPAAGKAATKGQKVVRKQQTKFTLHCEKAVSSVILDTTALADFFKARIKMSGKHNDLPERVQITNDKNDLHVTATPPFSKRFIKYLTNKYLAKQQLRDYLHVVAADKLSYEVKFFDIPNDEAA